MSIKYLNAAINASGFSSSEKIVLFILSNYADENGYCWPSMKVLMRGTGMSDRGIQKTLLKLIKWGVVQRQRRYRNERQTSNGYYLDLFMIMTPEHSSPSPVNTTTPPPEQGSPLLTTSIEPSVEPPIAGQKTVPKEIAMKSGVKGISKGTVKISADEVQTALSDKDKAQGTTDLLDEFVSKKLTAGTLAMFWRRLIALNCPEYGPMSELKKKEMGHLVQLKKYFGQKRVLESIAILVERWIDFTKHAEAYFDAYKSPLLPSLPYMVVNSQAAVSYREMVGKILQPIANKDQKHHNIVKGKLAAVIKTAAEVKDKSLASDEKPMSLEEFMIIEQEHEEGK